MKPRKFLGATSREVLKRVRETLGPDALIVSNAKVPGGIEVIALPSTAINDIVAVAGKVEPQVEAPLPAPPSLEGQQRREPVPVASAGQLAAAAPMRGQATPAPTLVPEAPSARDERPDQLVQSMIGEIRSMRSLLEQRLAALAWSDMARRDPTKVDALRTLLGVGFSPELARRLTDSLPDCIGDADLTKALVTEINRHLVTAGAENDIIEHGGVYALIGPTGVGKTTTTAKLAARGVVRHGADRVALLTTDTYRIGAHEQLRIYGRILGVTTCVVRDAAELKSTLSDLRGKHMVLIDTVGMSQRDKLVADQVATLTRCGGNVKRLLLLNATCNGDTLEDVVRCYQTQSVDGAILTKLDEAQSIGAALDVLIRHRLALNFVANGQRVPEDLHTPNRQYLIHRALRTLPAESPYALSDDEFPLVLSGGNEAAAAQSERTAGGRIGAYYG